MNAGDGIGDVALLVERKLGLDRLDRQRRASSAAGFVTLGRNFARGSERLGPRRLRLALAGENLINVLIAEPLVGADRRTVEAAGDELRRFKLKFGRDGEPILPGDQRAGVVGQRFRQHRLNRARYVDAGGAAARLTIDRVAGPHVGADVGDVNPDPRARVAQLLG